MRGPLGFGQPPGLTPGTTRRADPREVRSATFIPETRPPTATRRARPPLRSPADPNATSHPGHCPAIAGADTHRGRHDGGGWGHRDVGDVRGRAVGGQGSRRPRRHDGPRPWQGHHCAERTPACRSDPRLCCLPRVSPCWPGAARPPGVPISRNAPRARRGRRTRRWRPRNRPQGRPRPGRPRRRIRRCPRPRLRLRRRPLPRRHPRCRSAPGTPRCT